MPKKMRNRNEYRCCIETNNRGKYCVRVRVRFLRHGWSLPVYFLTSTLERAVRKLEQTLQLLQTQEDRLWFWCVDRSADPYVSDDMLREVGLRLDRRVEFPRRTENIAVAPEQRIPVGRLAPVQRALAESIGSGRVELSAS
jgi:hypothetical protein